jgi:hypothetical protein
VSHWPYSCWSLLSVFVTISCEREALYLLSSFEQQWMKSLTPGLSYIRRWKADLIRVGLRDTQPSPSAATGGSAPGHDLTRWFCQQESGVQSRRMCSLHLHRVNKSVLLVFERTCVRRARSIRSRGIFLSRRLVERVPAVPNRHCYPRFCSSVDSLSPLSL